MKIYLLLSCLFCFCFYNTYSNSKDCSHNCFNAEIVESQLTEGGCYNYTISVNYSGECTYALSHFSVETSCGDVSDLYNSEDWKQEIGLKDPKTGIYGFKIDDIKDFGEGGDEGNFTINFTICPDDENCNEILSDWTPVVAYKAGQCIYYDTLQNQEQDQPLNAVLNTNNPRCAESNDGNIIVEIISGDGPFTFMWASGDSTQNLRGLPQGNYSVEILDAYGDTLNLSTELISPQPLRLNPSIQNISCSESNKGGISLYVSGGTAPYGFLWEDGSIDSYRINLTAGNYSVIVTDTNGCTIEETIEVQSLNKLIINGATTKASCAGTDGAIDLTVDGGEGNYTFTWLDGPTTEDREALAPGFYTVTVSDERECSSSRTFSVKEENPISITGSITPTGCPDANTGGVNITVSGASGSLSYLWSDGSTLKDLSGVSGGRYEVVVTDENGCNLTKSFYVFAETINIQSEVINLACFGDTTGSISLTSEENIQVVWSHGVTTPSIYNLGEGLYIATITNDKGCSNTFSYYIDSPEPLAYQVTISNDSCHVSGYKAALDITGGIAPYTMEWDNGVSGNVNENLSTGTYSFTIFDQNNCQISGSVNIDSASTDCAVDSPEEEGTDGEGSGSEENPEGNGSDDEEDNSDGDDPENPDDVEGGNPEDEEDPTGDDDHEEGDSDGGDPAGDVEDDEEPGSGGDGGSVDEDGNEDDSPDGEEENPVEACSNPFDLTVSLVDDGDCRVYRATVAYTGQKSYGLSHATIVSSCGEIEGVYTETGVFENGNDLTTGIKGLKIDEIHNFGESGSIETFEFEYELCEEACSIYENIIFTIAYKYGQCISYDTVIIENPAFGGKTTAYPNPASDFVTFEYSSEEDKPVKIELYNTFGILVKKKVFESGEIAILDVSNLPGDFYTYRIITQKEIEYGKIIIIANN